jgi:hypothetical protein
VAQALSLFLPWRRTVAGSSFVLQGFLSRVFDSSAGSARSEREKPSTVAEGTYRRAAWMWSSV